MKQLYTHSSRRIAIGKKGEEFAAKYLQRSGYHVLHRNWRPEGSNHQLELDLVASNQEALVFIEVKTRTLTKANEFPVYSSFTHRKKMNVMRAATAYLSCHSCWHYPCRFDFIGILLLDLDNATLEHHKNVIIAGHSMDRSHTAWQPW